MQISVIGINHKTAPIEIRERFYLTRIQQELLISELKQHPNVCEAFALSTCNRTEIYLHTLNALEPKFIVELLTDIKSLENQESLEKYFIYILIKELSNIYLE